MPNYTKNFAIPFDLEHKDTLSTRYYIRIKANPSEFFSTYEPCYNCICLPVCLNKRAKHILHCPIVMQSFREIGFKMRTHTSTVVDVKYYDVLFWINKSSYMTATVELVMDDMIQCVSVTLDLFNYGMMDKDGETEAYDCT
jgi:hypothetical protein